MKKLTCILFLCASVLVGVLPASAQQSKRKSPHETISQKIDGNRVIIVYGRPYSKDPGNGQIRKIWGTLVPFGHVDRMGADEATLLITQQPIVLGGTAIPAGAYTLFQLHEENGSSKLIVSKQIGQWGLEYDAKQDFARVDMTKESIPETVDQFTMAIVKRPEGGGAIKLSWENTSFSVPFTVKK